MHQQVKIFSTPTCPYCVMAKDWLRAHNVSYEEVDVSKDENGAQEMVEKSGQMSVPVMIIGENVLVGFDESTMKQLLFN